MSKTPFWIFRYLELRHHDINTNDPPFCLRHQFSISVFGTLLSKTPTLVSRYTRIRGNPPPSSAAKSRQIKGGGLPRFRKILKITILAPHGVPYPRKSTFFGEFGFRTFKFSIQKNFWGNFRSLFEYPPPLEAKISGARKLRGVLPKGGGYPECECVESPGPRTSY